MVMVAVKRAFTPGAHKPLAEQVQVTHPQTTGSGRQGNSMPTARFSFFLAITRPERR